MLTVKILVDNEIRTFDVELQMARPLVSSVLAATNTGPTGKRTVQTTAYSSKVTGKFSRRNCPTDPSKPFIKVTMVTKCN